MRRSQPEDITMAKPMSPPPSRGRSLSSPNAADAVALDWGLLSSTPMPPACTCCACGEVYEASESMAAGAADGNEQSNPDDSPGTSGFAAVTRRRRPGGAEDSFVVLPDSTPVLSEGYFALSGSSVAGDARDFAVEGAAGSEETPDGVRSEQQIPGSSFPTAPGAELLKSGYSTGEGVAAGWTASGFGVGSAMLESIVQISHAGLSDNVRREALLHALSKRHPRHLDPPAATAPSNGRSGPGPLPQPLPLPPPPVGRREQELIEGAHDPILCCHCYATLLDRIEEDSRLADRDALAYRDFIELIDGIAAAADDDEHGAQGRAGRAGAPGQEAAAARRGETDRGRAVEIVAPSRTARADAVEEDSTGSTFARELLHMAQQTSAQLRTEMASLERQKEELCVRGMDAWAVLSDLAYMRGELGDECRELLKVSRELAEKASDLSERSALSELFTIRHADGFPSINGCRLGRAPEDRKQLHWNEINAAWGEALLVVRCVSNAMGFRSRRFRLAPLNCASRVIELAQARPDEGEEADPDMAPVAYVHDLFSTGGRSNDKQRFALAVRAFVVCCSEVIAEVDRRLIERRLAGETSSSRSAGVGWSDHGLPYNQAGDSVGGVSITSLKGNSAWKAFLCQLVKNLEWTLGAAASLCVT